jgi:hypothetical protein
MCASGAWSVKPRERGRPARVADRTSAVRTALFALLIGALTLPPRARAEEGLWTFDDAPTGAVRASVGLRLDRPWLTHLQRASVRLTSGCSGSVVSPQGLVLTSQHCIADCAQSLSGPGADHVRDGFLAQGRAAESHCPGLQAEILTAIVDVTGAVHAAAAGKFGQDYVATRQSALAGAETSVCGADPRLRCQVISFFDGAQLKVYKYRGYNDVRLVFAPEADAAFFGGDVDNFAFPRFALDFAFLRLYEDGQPAPTPDYLAWSTAPPKAGEAVVLAGNPGSTQRHLTAAQLAILRDVALPTEALQEAELRGRLTAFSQNDAEHRRVARQALFEAENTLKVLKGRLAALQDPALLEGRRDEERELKARLVVDPKLAAVVGDPWGEIVEAQRAYRDQYLLWRQLEAAAGGGSQLFDYARMLVRGTLERSKPASERLPDFADSRLPLLEKILLDPRPVSADLETLQLEFWLSKTRESLGVDSPAAGAFLGKEGPASLARRLATTSRLADPALRRALWEGGPAAVRASSDPLITYVLATDPISRAARRLWEDEVVGPSLRAGERIDRLRFALAGRPVYPDATFSLRLSYGKVAGATNDGAQRQPFTTFAGLFARATGAAPFELPARWREAQSRLDPAATLDFLTTTDIAGGGSGSPVVDAEGKIIGAAFDGNLASIAGDFVYDGERNRTISVATMAIDEALAKVYGANALLAELAGRQAAGGRKEER